MKYISALARRYLRLCPQISPLMSGDISARSLFMPYHFCLPIYI